MNVLQIRGEFSDNGPGTQMLTLSKELKRRGHNVEMAASGGLLKNKIEDYGFTFHSIPQLAINKRSIKDVITAVSKLRSLLTERNIEVVHAHNAATLYLAYLAARISGIHRSVKFFHSCRGIELRKTFFWRNWIYLGYPAKIFAVCQWTKDHLKKIGVRDNKITVTYNGVDFDRFDMKRRDQYRKEIRLELGIPDEAVVVGIIGRMGTKGHDELIKAFSKLSSKYSNLYMILVGGGAKFDEFKNLAKGLEVNKRLIFTGVRFDSEKMHASFDIFGLPSYWGEMFPNAILESMAYGNPIISTKLSGIPEMISTGEGFLIEPKDTEALVSKIAYLLDNVEELQQMGNKAYDTVKERFSIEAVVNTIEDQYRS